MFVTMKFLKNYIIKISGIKIDSENLNKKISAKNNPSLAQEWHSTLNIPLTPNNVTSDSDRKYGGNTINVDTIGKRLSIIEIREEVVLNANRQVRLCRFLVHF